MMFANFTLNLSSKLQHNLHGRTTYLDVKLCATYSVMKLRDLTKTPHNAYNICALEFEFNIIAIYLKDECRCIKIYIYMFLCKHCFCRTLNDYELVRSTFEQKTSTKYFAAQ